MKVLIWIGCFFANALITTFFANRGVTFGALPSMLLFGCTLWLARTLSKKWDERQEEKEAIKKACQQYTKPIVEQKTPITSNNTICTSQWQCSCGKLHPKYVSSCVCGKNKSDFINQVKPTQTNTVTTVPNPAPSSVTISFCRKCGAKLLDNAAFCSRCGTEIVRK